MKNIICLIGPHGPVGLTGPLVRETGPLKFEIEDQLTHLENGL
jgi:hypothetical protein